MRWNLWARYALEFLLCLPAGILCLVPVQGRLCVSLQQSANNFNLKLTTGSDLLAYTVSKDSQPLSAGDAVHTWESGKSIPGPATLAMTITDNEEKNAGEYSDTLTFTMVLTSAGNV